MDTKATKHRIVAIIQARYESSRLPGKVLLEIDGQPMLVWVVERTRRANTVDEVIVATTTKPTDDSIVNLCLERSYPYYRGSSQDVLDRYYQTARTCNAEIIVRITADCPFIDPDVIDQTVNAFLGMQDSELGVKTCILSSDNTNSTIPKTNSQIYCKNNTVNLSGFPFDFSANRLPPPWGRTFPIGLDTEVCAFRALEIAWKEANQKHHREHVMPYFYEHPERFRVLMVNYIQNFGSLRWTVDTVEDLELIRQIVSRFPDRNDFTWLEVLELIQHEPALSEINAKVQHKHYLQIDTRSR